MTDAALHPTDRPSKVVVLGGTGLIGRKLVARLRLLGHEVIAASRSTGVDLVAGKGLGEALRGADTVVDVSNPGYGEPADMTRFFEASCAHIRGAERAAGVSRHILLSATGVANEGTSGYFEAKRLQEKAAAELAIPCTIVRSSPFHEFIYNIVDSGGEGDHIVLPPLSMQPIGADDVADALARVVVQGPPDPIIEVAGPQAHRLRDLAEEILAAQEDLRTIVIDPGALYFGARMPDMALIPGKGARLASLPFDDWLRSSLEVPRPRGSGLRWATNDITLDGGPSFGR